LSRPTTPDTSALIVAGRMGGATLDRAMRPEARRYWRNEVRMPDAMTPAGPDTGSTEPLAVPTVNPMPRKAELTRDTVAVLGPNMLEYTPGGRNWW